MDKLLFNKHEITSDKVLQSTNDDAATSKLSAVKKGYYTDKPLEKLLSNIIIPFRHPMMLRGYYIRTFIMRDIVNKFIQYNYSTNKKFDERKRQIVNLGAGFDTLYYWMKEQSLLKDNNIKYYELDFLPVFQRKLKAMSQHKELLDEILNITNINITNGILESEEYCILSTDLRDTSHFSKLLFDNGFDIEVPTLFLSECVLIYMKPEHSQNIIKWIKNTLKTAFFSGYEQIKPNDPFGKVMIENLEKRGCALLGLHAFPNEDAQINRFLDENWNRAECYNMNILYNKYITNEDKRRIEKLQMLDELEEWILINDHYCISWAMFNEQDNINWDNLKFLNE